MLNPFFTVYLERKKIKKIEISVCNVTSHKSRQQTVELWKGVGLKWRDGAGDDQWKFVCVFLYKVWPCFMNLFRSYVCFCHRPLPLPRLLFASLLKQLISCPLNHDQPLYFHCESIWKLCTFLHSHGHAPFKTMNTNTHLHTHINTHLHTHTHTHTLNPHVKF